MHSVTSRSTYFSPFVWIAKQVDKHTCNKFLVLLVNVFWTWIDLKLMEDIKGKQTFTRWQVTERSLVLARGPFPETPLYLHRPEDSTQLYIPFWQLQIRTILVSVVMLSLLRRHRALITKKIMKYLDTVM